MTLNPSVEHLDVLIVGAGLSGIGAAHHIRTQSPWATYALFEARDSIGGTWDLFRYPGVRSDSDMFTLGYSFRPWDKAQTIVDGPDILQYIKDTAAEEGIDRHIRFHHRIISANWSPADARWTVIAERTDTGERVEVTCGFLLSCSGYYRYDHGYTPDFEGIDDFGGEVIHPQHWPEEFDPAGKRIVVIGSGATAITLIPNLATAANGVTMLQRSPTYITAMLPKSPAARLFRRILPEKQAGSATRWFHALTTQIFYEFCRRFPNRAKKLLRKGVELQLPKGYDIDTHFTPHYNPWDERLCVAPDGDFFRAIKRGTADVVTDHIDRFTSNGIQLQSGKHLDADVVVTATGLELLYLGGIDLRVDGEEVVPSEKMTFNGMMLEDVPNLAVVVGYTNASWTLKADLTSDYVGRLLTEMRQLGHTVVTPRNRGGSSSGDNVLGLTAGYVQRSAHLLPRQGTASPWRMRQSYLHDYRALKRGTLLDPALELSTPSAPAGNSLHGPTPNDGSCADNASASTHDAAVTAAAS